MDVLQFLHNKLAETSLKTPQRIEFIMEQIRLFVDSYTEDFNYVSLDINLPEDEKFFTPTLENIPYLYVSLDINLPEDEKFFTPTLENIPYLYVSLDINLPEDEKFFTPTLENIPYLYVSLERSMRILMVCKQHEKFMLPANYF